MARVVLFGVYAAVFWFVGVLVGWFGETMAPGLPVPGKSIYFPRSTPMVGTLCVVFSFFHTFPATAGIQKCMDFHMVM